MVLLIYKRSYLGRNPPKGVTLSMKSTEKTDTLFPGNNTTAAELEPLTIRTSPSLMGTLFFKEAAWLSG